eukprot:4020175-Pleurochrysis_carterae.AAC.6
MFIWFPGIFWVYTIVPESYAFARPRLARLTHARTRRSGALGRPPPSEPARPLPQGDTRSPRLVSTRVFNTAISFGSM